MVHNIKTNSLKGFTIVELLIVVVVIGILAAITIVSFGGITGQANVASLQTDLDNNSKKLQLYFAQYGSYPTTLDGSNCPTAPTADTNYCLKASNGTTLTYQIEAGNTLDYALYAAKGTTIYKVTSVAAPFNTKLTSACPTGFIVVPGSSTYNTSDFCVMKYEAKCASTTSLTTGLTSPAVNGTYDNATTACTAANSKAVVSTASGLPISSVYQTTASTYASSSNGCTGCHLIGEAEWLTIAQNVLSNPVNWSGNVLGSGYIYSGHNDSSPGNALAAAEDANGYYGTNNTTGNQKRTLTLTNGETIWDMAGNLYEWTSATMTGGQPGPASHAWRDWSTLTGGTFTTNPYPSASGISGSGTWTSANGIGQVWSNSADVSYRGFIRSGAYHLGSPTGIYLLNLNNSPTLSYSGSDVGFRAAR